MNMWDDNYATKNRPGSVPVCSSLQSVFIVGMVVGGVTCNVNVHALYHTGSEKACNCKFSRPGGTTTGKPSALKTPVYTGTGSDWLFSSCHKLEAKC